MHYFHVRIQMNALFIEQNLQNYHLYVNMFVKKHLAFRVFSHGVAGVLCQPVLSEGTMDCVDCWQMVDAGGGGGW